jgi:2-dehydropantoate 2-reductase
MRVLFAGAGAIGTYVGGSLALAGHDVSFVARPAQAQRLTEQGITLHWAPTGESKSTRRIGAYAELAAAMARPPYDCLLLTVKTFDVAPFVAALRAVTGTPPPVVALQNGVGAEAEISAVFGEGAVIAGTVTTSVSRPAEAIVVERARGVGLAAGHALSSPLAEAMTQAGLNARLYPAAGPVKWSKLLLNLVGNATSAILDMPVSELFGDPRLYAVEAATMRECLRVMRGLGLAPVNLPGVPVRLLAWAVSRLPAGLARPLLRRSVGAGRGAKMPSLNLDVQAGRPQTEVRWLNGAVLEHGARLGIPTPVNRVLTETVEALSAGRLAREEFRRRPEAFLRLFE